MDIERLRREVAEELAHETDSRGDDLADLDAVFAELSAKTLPESDVIELLVADAPELSVADGFAEREARRISAALSSLDAQAEPIGDLLARHRRERGLNVEHVARRIGVAADMLAQIEQGRAPARLLALPIAGARELANTLGIPIDRFVLSVARSIPRPDGFVYGYQPRLRSQEAEAPYIEAQSADRLVRWIAEFLAQ